jgi:hypothetical protein
MFSRAGRATATCKARDIRKTLAFTTQFSERLSLVSIPRPFLISPLAFPCLNVEPDSAATCRIHSEALNDLAKVEVFFAQNRADPIRSRLSRVFLSISFGEMPEPVATRRLFREVFQEAEIETIEGDAAGIGLLSQVREQMRNCDVTLAGLTELRSNVIMEIGIADRSRCPSGTCVSPRERTPEPVVLIVR